MKSEEIKYAPLVSIVIPVYNGANFMGEAIDSALAQTDDNYEIIVVNDGSNDDDKTEEIALSYGDRIRYIAKPNGGVSSALNVAIQNMKGEWLSWLSHDDKYKPNKLETQVKKLNELKEQGEDLDKICLYAASERINVNGTFISRKHFNIKNEASPIDTLISNIRAYSIGGCSVLMSKNVLDTVGGFDENIRTVSDADLWFRMMLNGVRFIYDDVVIVQSRQHKQQVGNRSMSLFEKEHAALMEKFTLRLLEENISVDQKYRLLESLVLNGHDASATLVKQSISENGESSLWGDLKVSTIIKLRRDVFFAARKLYRSLTLR